VHKFTPRAVVGVLAASRVGIGLAFAIGPRRLTRESTASADAVLMTRSFAIREIALGVGGLLAAARATVDPRGLALWAGLGALVDAGDLAAAVASQEAGTRLPAVLATAGLCAESWALLAADRASASRA
jgi:hypothetical protein